MSEIDWAAGLFEGEGSIGIFDRSGCKVPRVTLQLRMTDEDVVRRFHRAIGFGQVGGPYSRPSRPADKPVWAWTCGSWLDVFDVLLDLYPRLGIRRRRKAHDALQVLLTPRRPTGPTRSPCS